MLWKQVKKGPGPALSQEEVSPSVKLFMEGSPAAEMLAPTHSVRQVGSLV